MDTLILILLLLVAIGAIAATLYYLTNDGYRRVPTLDVCDHEYR